MSDSKNNQRKKLNGRVWKSGEGKAGNGWRRWPGSSSTDKAAASGTDGPRQGAVTAERPKPAPPLPSQPGPAPRRCGLKGQERDGGAAGCVTSPSLHSACGCLFRGVYPHLRAGEDTEPREGPPGTAEQVVDPTLKRAAHMVVTVGVHICHDNFPAGVGHESWGRGAFC